VCTPSSARAANLFVAMALHRTSGRTNLGLALAAACMLAWGTLPIALTLLLRTLDPVTLTWFRVCVSAIVLVIVLAHRGALPALRELDWRGWGLLVLATAGLLSNYIGYLIGLELTTPANIQVLSQLSPLILVGGGVWLFGERLARPQLIGFGALIGGLGLFFADQLGAMAERADRYLLGTAVIVGASITWSIYGLAQKQLLTRMPSQSLMVCVYAGCALALTPLAQPTGLSELSAFESGLLAYCALNTVVAYGAFSASLEHAEASRVGAVISLTPVATVGFIGLTEVLSPGLLVAEHLSLTTLLGALIVVGGSVMASLGAVDPSDRLFSHDPRER
jgi:drug/metabolite transporter (DMT)-like permease